MTRPAEPARLVAGAIALAIAGDPAIGLAQRPLVVWTAGPSSETGRAELWARRVARGLEHDGHAIDDSTDRWARAPEGIDPDRVARIAGVERAIVEAQALAAALDEPGAIARLAEAEARARELFDVPGAVAWYVEIELELAALAHQLGRTALATASLERAAALGPDRALRAAEAPPDLVALHDEARRSFRARAPSATTIDAPGVEGAVVWVDDLRLGAAPARLEVASGLHAVRLEAPGHLPWGGLLELPPGSRPPIDVVVSPEPAVSLARDARGCARALDLDALTADLAALGREAPAGVVLVVAGSGVLDRAAAILCDAERCRGPLRLEGTAAADLEALESDDEASGRRVADATDWLDEPIPVEETPLPPPTEWWQEWWPWATGAAVVIGAGLGIGLGVGLAPEPPPQRVYHCGDAVIPCIRFD